MKEFEKEVLEGEENFENWDDYIEWKAYACTYKDRMRDLKNLKDEKILKLLQDSKVVKKYETFDFKLFLRSPP